MVCSIVSSRFLIRLPYLTLQIADIIALEGEDTFTRPIYAGNAILKIKSSPKDKIKIVTVRTTAFDKAKIGGGSASTEEIKEVSADSAYSHGAALMIQALQSTSRKSSPFPPALICPPHLG